MIRKFTVCTVPLHVVQTGSETFPASGIVGIFSGIMLPGREAHYTVLTSAEVKETWFFTSAPLRVFMAYCPVNHRDNFAILIIIIIIRIILYYFTKYYKRQWLRDPNEIDGDNLSNVRREASRHLANKRREYLKDKIKELATKSKNKNIRDLHRGINECKRGYQPRSN
jgi:hypothetical protein